MTANGLPWVAAKPAAGLTAPPHSVYIALPPKVQWKGPNRGSAEWVRWIRAGAFVHNFARWNWFVALNFRFDDVKEGRARGLFRRWLDALASEAGTHLKVAFAIEPHLSGAPHVHALIAVPEDAKFVSIDRGRTLWAFGQSWIRDFDEDAGGAWYVTKTANWDLTYACPRSAHKCRRHGGCAFARANGLKT